MELEFFDSEKHDYFLEEFRKFSRGPTEEEEEFFQPILEQLVGQITEIGSFPTDFKLYFAMTDEEKLDGDLPINRFVHGFSFAEWMEGFDRNVLMVRAVKDRENWKGCLINMIAHELAHQEYYRAKRNAPYSNWHNLFFEGHAMNRAERVAEKLGVDWRPHYRSERPPGIDVQKVISVLDEDRTYDADSIFENGEEPCPDAEGYNLAYQVVKDIVQRTDFGFGEIPKMEEDRMRTEVEESIRRLY